MGANPVRGNIAKKETDSALFDGSNRYCDNLSTSLALVDERASTVVASW